MNTITLSQLSKFKFTDIPLPSSKSESNRVLVIDALTKGENQISNLAEARDTQTMIRLLETNPPVFDVLDAGTTMRFLTAFATVTSPSSNRTSATTNRISAAVDVSVRTWFHAAHSFR